MGRVKSALAKRNEGRQQLTAMSGGYGVSFHSVRPHVAGLRTGDGYAATILVGKYNQPEYDADGTVIRTREKVHVMVIDQYGESFPVTMPGTNPSRAQARDAIVSYLTDGMSLQQAKGEFGSEVELQAVKDAVEYADSILSGVTVAQLRERREAARLRKLQQATLKVTTVDSVATVVES